MNMRALLRLFGQPVTIEAYTGTNSAAVQQFAAPVSVRAVVEETDQLDRTAAPTDDALTLATLRMLLTATCPHGSRVTLASGRRGYVTSAQRWDGRTSPARLVNHLEVRISGSFTA